MKGVPLNPPVPLSSPPEGKRPTIQIKRFLSSSQLMAFLGDQACQSPISYLGMLKTEFVVYLYFIEVSLFSHEFVSKPQVVNTA